MAHRKSISNRDSMDFASKYGNVSIVGGNANSVVDSAKKQTWTPISPSINCKGMSKQK